MLCYTDDEKRRVGIGVQRKGVLGTVASVPFALVRGTVNAVRGGASPTAAAAEGPDSLADSWIDFLIQQAEAADVAEAQNRQNALHAGQPLGLVSRWCRDRVGKEREREREREERGEREREREREGRKRVLYWFQPPY
jgi:hypothetical protein